MFVTAGAIREEAHHVEWDQRENAIPDALIKAIVTRVATQIHDAVTSEAMHQKWISAKKCVLS